jgi:AcrR family transcriptional regulator
VWSCIEGLPLSDVDPTLVHPAKQARSRARMERIVEAGLELVNQHRFDEITMGMIAERAGCSVGTLYKRFASKEALLVVLADTARLEIARELSAGLFPAEADDETLRDILLQAIRYMTTRLRAREGLVRAMLTRQLTRPGAVRPLREAGLAILRATAERSANRRPPHLSPHEFEQRLRIGFQVLIGTLVNMIVNQPGPLGLHDEATPDRLTDVVHAYVTAPRGPTPS